MITVEWHDNQTCRNCGKDKPHCAEIDFNFDADSAEPSPDKLFNAMLCGDCVADLQRRLS